MTEYLLVRDGGKTDELGFMYMIASLMHGAAGTPGSGVTGLTDLQVSQHAGSPNKSVDIAIGDVFIPYLVYGYWVYNSAIYNLAIASNASGNPRIDAVAAYVDRSVVSSASADNPGALKFIDVQGTPAGSPTAPLDADIQTAVGAGNPFYRLANVAVANGFTQIVNANITDTRQQLVVGNSKTIDHFVQSGNISVVNDISSNYVVPPGVSAISRIDAVIKTAPTGAAAIFNVYNITQAAIIGTVTIAAGAFTGFTTTITTPNLNTGDRIRLDCTQIGSIVAGASVSVECT